MHTVSKRKKKGNKVTKSKQKSLQLTKEVIQTENLFESSVVLQFNNKSRGLSPPVNPF